MFPCLVELWESPQLSKLNPKVVELLIATIKHLYSNEKLLETKVAEFFKSTSPAPPPKSSAIKPADAATSSGSSGSSGPSAPPPPPPPHPSVDPLFLQQLCDMGFSREHAEEALIACANDLTAAMDWILNHPPPSAAAAPVSPGQASCVLWHCPAVCVVILLSVVPPSSKGRRICRRRSKS